MAYRARVENVMDPKKLGRVQIRVPSLHGHSDHTPTSSLPWASYVDSLGGGFDSGSLLIPETGSTVLVDKETGSDNWYVLGVIRGTGSVSRRGEGDEIWLTDPSMKEIPSDSVDGFYKNPVIYKSPKGATFRISDVDDKECLDIISHNGATFRMATPLGKYTGHKSSRCDMSLETQIGDKDTCIVIKDGFSNLVRLMGDSETGGTIEVVGNGPQKSGVNLNSKTGNLFVFVSSDGNRSEISMTNNSISLSNGKSSIVIRDGNVEIDCDSLTIRTDSTNLNGNNVSIASNSSSLTGSSISIGGGSVDIGPITALGVPVSKSSVQSKSPAGLGSWNNDIDKRFGGDKDAETDK